MVVIAQTDSARFWGQIFSFKLTEIAGELSPEGNYLESLKILRTSWCSTQSCVIRSHGIFPCYGPIYTEKAQKNTERGFGVVQIHRNAGLPDIFAYFRNTE